MQIHKRKLGACLGKGLGLEYCHHLVFLALDITSFSFCFTSFKQGRQSLPSQPMFGRTVHLSSKTLKRGGK